MTIGIYGGTFDPIHKGHILPIREARRALDLEQVIYIPTAQPPHKAGLVVASAHARFAMVELALLWEPGMVVSTHELDQPGPTYTIDTIEHFQRTTDDEIMLVVGSDAFAGLDTWRDWQRLLTLVEIGVLMRPGWDRERLDRELSGPLAEAAQSDRIRFVDNRPVPASSSELRKHLESGRRPSSIPRLVLDYMSKYELYKPMTSASSNEDTPPNEDPAQNEDITRRSELR